MKNWTFRPLLSNFSNIFVNIAFALGLYKDFSITIQANFPFRFFSSQLFANFAHTLTPRAFQARNQGVSNKNIKGVYSRFILGYWNVAISVLIHQEWSEDRRSRVCSIPIRLILCLNRHGVGLGYLHKRGYLRHSFHGLGSHNPSTGMSNGTDTHAFFCSSGRRRVLGD